MNYDQIVTFLSLTETKNFNRTAELLYVSQPTITARIKSLEQEVTQTLFVRTNKYVELTAAGKQFLPYALEIYNTMRECKVAMTDKQLGGEVISISAPSSCWDYGPLTNSIIDYSAEHSELSMNLLRNVSKASLALLQNGRIDIGVVYVLPNDLDYIAIPYVSEELLLVASPKMDLSQYKNFLDDQINPLPMLVRPHYSALSDQLVEDYLYKLPSRISCDHVSLNYEFVKRGLGIGLLQMTAVKDSIANGDLVVLDCDYNQNPLLHKNYFVMHRRDEQRFKGLIEKLIDDAKNYFLQ